MINKLLHTFDIYIGVHKRVGHDLYTHPNEEYYFNLIKNKLEELIREVEEFKEYTINIVQVKKVKVS